MRIPSDVASRLRAAIETLGEDTLPDRLGRAHGALPLWADLGGAILLRPDGMFLELEWDQPSEQQPREVDEPSWSVALVAGAERYPWLAGLLPSRPEGAIDCSDCHGEGHLRFDTSETRGTVYCGTCDGLGWRAA